MNILSGADVLGTLHPQNQAKIEKSDWYKDAVIYQLHVKAFADSNNDGIGDFIGLQNKLDYLQDLGVNTLWLLPFFKSRCATMVTTSPTTARSIPLTAR
jgi:pullulanase/glycogen debranching enzyme